MQATTSQRWSLYPIQHQNLWDMYKTHVSTFWTVEEIDMSRDERDFTNRLSTNEQLFFERILAFFAFGDGMVMENLMTRFFHDVVIPEARQFYAVQGFSEAIHAETYALLLQTLVKDETRRLSLFDMTQADETLRAKAEWMLKWMDPSLPLTDRLVAYACIEGIFFSSSFAAIFWLKTKNVCHGLTFSNELISRDEGLHRDFAVELWKVLTRMDPIPTHMEHVKKIQSIIMEAVELEIDFMKQGLTLKPLLGLDSQSMSDYVCFVGDHLMKEFTSKPIYGVSNPFPFMDMISIEGVTNFFERRVSEYSKSRVGIATKDCTFRLDMEF